jgi:hypothetical protein
MPSQWQTWIAWMTGRRSNAVTCYGNCGFRARSSASTGVRSSDAAAPGTEAQLDALRGTSLETQGNKFRSELALSVYALFGVISTARICMAAGLGYRETDSSTQVRPYRHECQTHLVEYPYTNSPFAIRDE